MNHKTLKIERDEKAKVSVLYLSRPEVLNAMNTTMFTELGKALEELSDENTRCLVITGEGRAFSSGLDLSSFSSLSKVTTSVFRKSISAFQKPFLAIENFHCPVIAAIKGPALGGATELALACDIRFAERDAVMGLLELKYGIIPDLGSCRRLARLIGPGLAKELIFTARAVNAEEALEIGFIEHISEDGKSLSDALDLAEKLAKGPYLAIGLAKLAVNRCLDLPSETAADIENLAQTICITSNDHMRAVASALGNEEADYQGD